MRSLTAADIVRIVEWGEDKHPLDRALGLLGTALPGVDREELLALPMGDRNRRLLEVRKELLGSKLEVTMRCRACSEVVAFGVGVELLLATAAPEGKVHELVADGTTLRFRLPTSVDLAAVVGIGSADAARAALLERCVEHAAMGEERIALSALPSSVRDALGARMSDLDPLADITFETTCCECGASLSAALDVEQFVWAELQECARRIHREVHLLARAYGWTEKEILAMSAERRHRYSRMAEGG